MTEEEVIEFGRPGNWVLHEWVPSVDLSLCEMVVKVVSPGLMMEVRERETM